MKNYTSKSIRQIGWLALFLAIAWSCQKENVTTMTAKSREQASLAARNNSQLLTAAQDVADITSTALAGQGVAGGRTLTYGRTAHHDHDPCEPNVTGTFSFTERHDTIIYSGKLTIDFGDGSSCHDSTEVHKGKIIDSFNLIIVRNDSVTFDLTDSITFQGFQKDTVTVDGLFIKKSTNWKQWTLDIHDGKITYSDGSSVTWSGSLTTMIGPGAPGSNNDGDSDDDGSDSTHVSDGDGHYGHYGFSKTVTGSIHGTTRDGADFTAEITKALVYQCGCSKRIPVSGTVKITVAGVESDVDYGDGTCDRKYSVTTAGVTTDYSLGKI